MMKPYITILHRKNLRLRNKITFIVVLIFFQNAFSQDTTFTWDLARLDLGRNHPKLSALEADVLLELNKVRTNPALYATLYLKPRLGNFDRLIYNGTYATKEGSVVVLECIKELNQTKPIGVLTPNDLLIKLAKKHTTSQGRTKEVGHTSPNGKTFRNRIKKLEKKGYVVGENIDYGSNSGQEIVCSLLIDDGVKDRGHRKNILNRYFNFYGISFGTHKKYNYMCTIDFATMVR